MVAESAPDADASRVVLFDAILHPHRSLGIQGFRILMGVVILANVMVGGIFLLHGAWPVLAFCGLDILALWLAFRFNYRAARLYERVRLTEKDLTVQRVAWKRPERTWTFQPFWLRVNMDDPPRQESQVTLTSHGQSVVVGSFLSPDERADFAKALKRALTTWRDRLTQPKAAR
jgi:uncharacterized membrane protein